MKAIKVILVSALFVFAINSFFVSEVNAQTFSYKSNVTIDSNGCIVSFCTNLSGNNCSTPGSINKSCPDY